MYRTQVIVFLTFREAVVQPIYSLLLALGVAILLIFGVLPFFTLGEDTTMYKSVGLDVVLLIVLVSTLFATSKSIFDEIEDRTMLTLMSKPVKKWEVIVGKYLGIILSAALAVAILGATLIVCTCFRIPNDYQLQSNALDDRIRAQISDWRWMHSYGLLPSLILVWLQVSVLAAISVALSTRFSLVVNLPAVILIYIAGNLTRFLYPLDTRPVGVRVFGRVAAALLPFLQTFDLRSQAVYREVAVPHTAFAHSPGAIAPRFLWAYLAVAALYAIAYATFALGSGLFLFQTRELGGAEG
jgi:ABC-type Na+ efflux pump permease subunit